MLLDLTYASPAFNTSTGTRSNPAGLLPFLSWPSAIAPLLDATWDTHVFVEHRSFLIMLKHGMLKILSGQYPTFDFREPYPEAFVFGSAHAYAETVHETASGARMFDLSKAFAALHLNDRSPFIADPFFGSGYRCLSDTTAAKFGRCVLEAAMKVCDQSTNWVPPMKRTSQHSADGAQDGLLKTADRHFWVQFTGGEKPSLLSGKKAPVAFAKNFFTPEGETQMKSGKAAKRLKLFGNRTPARANIVHLAVGKASPLASTRSTVRGMIWESITETGEERCFVQTITVHPLMAVGSIELKGLREV